MEILLVVQVIVVVALIGIILMQKSSSDGFTGGGGGSPTSFLSGRSQANLFTRITAILATIFLVNSLVLAYLAAHTERGIEIIEEAEQEVLEAEEIEAEKVKNIDDLANELLDDNAESVEVEKKIEEIKQNSEESIKEIKQEAEEKLEEIKEEVKDLTPSTNTNP